MYTCCCKAAASRQRGPMPVIAARWFHSFTNTETAVGMKKNGRLDPGRFWEKGFGPTLMTFSLVEAHVFALWSSDIHEVINSWLRGIILHEHALVLMTLERLTNLFNWVVVNTVVPALLQCQFAHVCWRLLTQHLQAFAPRAEVLWQSIYLEAICAPRACASTEKPQIRGWYL